MASFRPLLARVGGALAALLLLTSPGFAPIGARTPVQERQQAIRATPALWVVRDADTTVYLFGTIHVLPPGVQWLDGPVRRAFDASDTLVLEVVTGDKAEMAKALQGLAVDGDGPPLTQKLDAPTLVRYRALLGSLGVSPDTLERFHPWYAAVFLSVAPLEKLGYSTDAGVEDGLKRAAAEAGKRVQAFETIDEQLGYFASLPEPVQLRYLSITIDEASKAEDEINRMTRDWSAGRVDSLGRELNASLDRLPEVAEALLFRRNERWGEWITERMRYPGTVFVAVGAGHLVGNRSVQAELAKQGLHARRIGTRSTVATTTQGS